MAVTNGKSPLRGSKVPQSDGGFLGTNAKKESSLEVFKRKTKVKAGPKKSPKFDVCQKKTKSLHQQMIR